MIVIESDHNAYTEEAHLLGHLHFSLGLCILGVRIVVTLNDDHHPGLWVNNKLAWGELQREGDLVEHSAKLFKSKDTQGVRRDRNDALGTLLARESCCIFKSVVGEGCEVESVAVVVGDPCPAAHGQYSLSTLHGHAEKFHWS